MKIPLISWRWFVVPALLVACVFRAPAPAYMKFDGVEGESTATGHVGEIDVICFGHSLSRSNSAPMPTIGDFVITKSVDKATPKLAEACAKGEHIPTAILSVRKAGATTTNHFYKVEFQDVVISSYQIGPSCSGEPVPTESISFNFTKIVWIYEPQTSEGVPTGPPVTGEWPPGTPIP